MIVVVVVLGEVVVDGDDGDGWVMTGEMVRSSCNILTHGGF